MTYRNFDASFFCSKWCMDTVMLKTLLPNLQSKRNRRADTIETKAPKNLFPKIWFLSRPVTTGTPIYLRISIVKRNDMHINIMFISVCVYSSKRQSDTNFDWTNQCPLHPVCALENVFPFDSFGRHFCDKTGTITTVKWNGISFTKVKNQLIFFPNINSFGSYLAMNRK